MIRAETLEIINLLNKLVYKSQYGYIPLSQVKNEYVKGIVYDDKNPLTIEKNNLYPVLKSYNQPKISEEQVKYYNNEFSTPIKVLYTTIKGDKPIIIVQLNCEDKPLNIIVTKTHWETV